MKIILSRKGFDSSSGGCPNPIFPDGKMLSLPIPDSDSLVKYRDLNCDEKNIGTVVHQLTNGKVRSTRGAHLDPDLDASTYPRETDWKPLLGQHGSAQGHLRNQGVGVGDLFLFFGLFQAVRRINKRWQFDRSKPAKHVIWGWMFVDAVINVDRDTANEYPWLHYHPHLQWPDEANNTLYLASEIGAAGLKGSGVFQSYHDDLCLTDLSSSRPSQWRLPTWFYPNGRAPLSYHSKQERWRLQDSHCLLNSAARGQEFVFDSSVYPEALPWINRFISAYG